MPVSSRVVFIFLSFSHTFMYDNLDPSAAAYFKNKKILITGAAGTIGAALVERILPFEPRVLRLLDNNEEKLFFLNLHYRNRENVRGLLGDVRDRERMARAMHDVDCVIHTAALKHVGLGEYNPFEVVKTNLLALQGLIECAIDANVGRFIFTSSDKAVNPTNVMGGSKFIGERLIASANAYRGNARTVFTSTRFGNVIGSAGSVIPIFRKQLAAGKPLTVTNPGMSLFFMTLAESVDLVLSASTLALGGEIFVPKMHAMKLMDLAESMSAILAPGKKIPIHEIGLRSGEKLYEELFSDHELPRCLETERMFIVLPYFEETELAIDGHDFAKLSPSDYPVDSKWASQTYSSKQVQPLSKSAVLELMKTQL